MHSVCSLEEGKIWKSVILEMKKADMLGRQRIFLRYTGVGMNSVE